MYDKAVDMAEQNSLAIVRETAQLIHQEKLTAYVAMPLEALAERLVPTLQMQLRYLRTGNVEEWQATCTQIVDDRVKQGLDYQEVIRAGQLLVQSLANFFEREISKESTFEGQPSAKVLINLQRRLQGLSVVATAAATAVGIRHKSPKPNL